MGGCLSRAPVDITTIIIIVTIITTIIGTIIRYKEPLEQGSDLSFKVSQASSSPLSSESTTTGSSALSPQLFSL